MSIPPRERIRTGCFMHARQLQAMTHPHGADEGAVRVRVDGDAQLLAADCRCLDVTQAAADNVVARIQQNDIAHQPSLRQCGRMAV
jgi:hypothetical protein